MSSVLNQNLHSHKRCGCNKIDNIYFEEIIPALLTSCDNLGYNTSDFHYCPICGKPFPPEIIEMLNEGKFNPDIVE